MPIKGLISDQPTLREGLPLIARLRKGDEKPEKGNRPGKDLDYFRIDFEPQFAEYAELFNELYGDQPDYFTNVHVVGETVDEAFDYWMEDYNTSGTLLHRCDGEIEYRWYDPTTTFHHNGERQCAKNPENTRPECSCSKVGRLSVIFKDFTAITGVFGYFLISTGSINDIVMVYNTLRMAERLAAKANHSLSAVPFHFGRVPHEISAPTQEKGKDGQYKRTNKRIKVTKSLFFLHADPEYNKAVLLPALVNAPALPAPQNEAAEQPALPSVTGEQAIRRLGNGRSQGKSRRIGASTEDDKPTIIEGKFEPPANAKYDLEALKKAVGFMYNGNDFHIKGSIEKLITGGKGVEPTHIIKPEYDTMTASVCVLIHRAQKDHKLDTSQIVRLLKEQDNGVKSIGDYLKRDHTLQDVWGVIQAHKATPDDALEPQEEVTPEPEGAGDDG